MNKKTILITLLLLYIGLLVGCSAVPFKNQVSLYVECDEFTITDGNAIFIQNIDGYKRKILDKNILSWRGYFNKDEELYLVKVYKGKKINQVKIVMTGNLERIIKCQTRNSKYE